MNNISPQLQNQITQFQQVQQQIQTASTQKIQMEAQVKEIDRTIEELDKATGDVYKNVGSLMIKVSDKDAVKMELEEGKETYEVRIKSLERQEAALRERFEALQDTINKAMGQGQQSN